MNKLYCAMAITVALLNMNIDSKQVEVPQGFGVNFHKSMEQTDHYKQSEALSNWRWSTAIDLYNDYISNVTYSEQPRIPKIIHRIWLGGKMPKAEQEFGKTWVENHPDWEYKLWTDKEVAELGLECSQAYKQARNYGEKSDIVRYEVLYRFGGLYVDTDFECLRSFDFFHHTCDFYSGVTHGTDQIFAVMNGLIASAPGHPILKECIDRLKRRLPNIRTHGRTGPHFFSKCIMDVLPKVNDTVVLFPVTYFYPWPRYFLHQKSRQDIEKWLRLESFAIHHWHVSWAKKK